MQTLPVADSHKQRSRARAVTIVVILCALLLALPLWNLAVLMWQQTHVVFPGNLYMVDGRSMRSFAPVRDRQRSFLRQGWVVPRMAGRLCSQNYHD